VKRLSVNTIILELKKKGISVKRNIGKKIKGLATVESFTITQGEEVMADVSEAELRGFAMNRGIV
jgi:hypothetical protein